MKVTKRLNKTEIEAIIAKYFETDTFDLIISESGLEAHAHKTSVPSFFASELAIFIANQVFPVPAPPLT